MSRFYLARQFMRNQTGIKRSVFYLLLFLAGATVFPVNAAVKPSTQNTLRAMDISTGANGSIIAKIAFDQPLERLPTGVMLDNPARLYFDFPGVGNSFDKPDSVASQGVLRGIHIAQTESRTRLVMNLQETVGHDAKIDGHHLLITLVGVARSTQNTLSQPLAARQNSDQQQQLSLVDLDFRRGTQGEGQIRVDLSQPGAVIDVRRQGNRLHVEFMHAYLPSNLKQRLDVTDFATPVRIIETRRDKNRVSMLVEPQGNWEHSAFQAGTSFVLDIRPIASGEAMPIHKKLASGGYTGEKLSLNFQDVEIRAVLQVIADFTDLNIIASDSVRGNLTIRLKNVPWDQALDIVLQNHDLDKRRAGNVIFVAPREEMAAKEKLQLEQQQQISELEVLQTETFTLNYRTASSIALKGIMSQRGTIEVDDISNTLTITDVPARLAEVAKHITNLDTQVRQVMIETRIVEATDTFSRNLGARFGVQNATRISDRRLGISGNLDNSSELATGAPTGGGENLNVNLPAAALAGVAGGPAALGLSLIKINNGTLINLELSALESDSKGRIIASPRLVTANRVEASIEQGTEIPFQTVSVTRPQIQFKKAVLGLRVTPQITPDNHIIMKLKINQDTRGENTPSGPAIDTKQIITEVLVENGGTVVIGGIFEQTEKNDRNRVPFLADVPILGHMFRNTSRRNDKRELLIFVTPRILNETLGDSIRSALNY
ncbi:MAG: type IV pilus secretin PilQ [Nitrosomonas sp.]|nr:type IV pilus secretin PilQ [Nitrosomonas sp.]